MSTVRVRYMINDLDPAVSFYTKYLGFQVKQEAKPNFAMLSRGNLELVLSTNWGPGGAAKPMLDGRKAEPGGWNRIILNVDDLESEVARLRKTNVHFRNNIATGPGGSEILLDDPSGNPIELFRPARQIRQMRTTWNFEIDGRALTCEHVAFVSQQRILTLAGTAGIPQWVRAEEAGSDTQVNAASIDTDVPMSSGSHFLIVKAWTNLGTNFLSGVNVTVQ